MRRNPWEERDRSGRFAALLAAGGAATAFLALALAGAVGEPYLAADGVNGWLVVFAAGLLAALIALPFGLEWRLRARQPDRDRRWELALVVWGALATALVALAVVIGFDTGTLGGAAALIAAIEGAGVVATVGFWLLAGG